MARVQIDKAGIRNRLKARREPYWGAPIARSLFVGYRKTEAGWGTWIARWRDSDGKQRYHSVGPVSDVLDYEAARKAAIRWMKLAAAGTELFDVRTVTDACKEYVEDRRKTKGNATAHDAEMRFRRTVYEHTIGKTLLERIRQKQIEDWRDALVSPIETKVRALSKSSANRTLTSLKAALNLAVARRYVSNERTIEWGLVKAFEGAEKRRDLYLDLKQRRALLASSIGAVHDLVEGVMLTGARVGELASATRSQFDHRIGSITLKGKTGDRKVPLSPPAIDLFKRLSQDKLPATRLFLRDDGKPWAHSDWDGLVRNAAAIAKLPSGVCLYTLRHSFITTAILEGLTPLEVARLVGTSLAMIDRHYGHLAQTAARERLALVKFI